MTAVIVLDPKSLTPPPRPSRAGMRKEPHSKPARRHAHVALGRVRLALERGATR